MQTPRGGSCTYGPEFDEILDDCCTNHYTVEWRIGQKQDKVLVVWESNTVIHPERRWHHNNRKEKKKGKKKKKGGAE